MAAGSCRHCGYQPVAFDAPFCPKCAGTTPNPSERTKRETPMVIVGSIVGGVLGAAVGGVLGGVILGGGAGGGLGGGVMGLMVGWLAGVVVAWFLLPPEP